MAKNPEQDLIKLTKWRTTRHKPLDLLGDEVVEIFKHDLEKRQKKFGKIGEVWIRIVPPTLQEVSELTALVRGTLTVIVQGSSHLFNMKQAMLAGLQEQLLHECRAAGLKKVVLKPGKLTR